MEMMTNEDLAYAAGIIDGEGTITITRRKDRHAYRGMIRVNMCEPEAVTFLHSSFGGSMFLVHPRKLAHRDQFCWCVAAVKAADCATKIFPFLRVKQRQAMNLIELQKINAAIRRDTTIQRTWRSGPLHAHGSYTVNPTFVSQSALLYESSAELNTRGRHSPPSSKAAAIRPTPIHNGETPSVCEI